MRATLTAGTTLALKSAGGYYEEITGLAEIVAPEINRTNKAITAIDDADDVIVAGRRSVGSLSITGYWDEDNAQHVALLEASNSGLEQEFLFALPLDTVRKMEFTALPDSFAFTNELDSAIGFTVSLKVTGSIDIDSDAFIASPVFDVDFTQGIGGGTFTRSTTATYYNATTGYRETSAIDEPRIAKDPITGLVGLEFEPDRTNHAPDSGDVQGTANYTDLSFYLQVTDNAGTGADNTSSMNLLQCSASFGAPTVSVDLPASIPDDSRVIVSMDCKVSGGGGNWYRAQLKSRDTTTTNSYVYFDISGDGAVGQIDTGDLDALYASVTPLENNVVRIACGFNISSGSTTPLFIFSQRTGDGGAAASPGDQTGGSDGLFVDALQIEVGGYPSSYIPNSGSGTTDRARDDLTYPIPSDFDEEIGSFFCEVSLKGSKTDLFAYETPYPGISAGIFGATGVGECIFIDVANDDNVYLSTGFNDEPGNFKTGGGAGGTSLTSNTPALKDTIYKACLTYTPTLAADGFTKRLWYINGSDGWGTNSPLPGTASGDTPPLATWNRNPDTFLYMDAPTTFEVGGTFESFGAFPNAGMYLNNVRIYNKLLTDAEAKALST